MTIPDRLSTALSERYRVERELGQGGMATVYQAHDNAGDKRLTQINGSDIESTLWRYRPAPKPGS